MPTQDFDQLKAYYETYWNPLFEQALKLVGSPSGFNQKVALLLQSVAKPYYYWLREREPTMAPPPSAFQSTTPPASQGGVGASSLSPNREQIEQLAVSMNCEYSQKDGIEYVSPIRKLGSDPFRKLAELLGPSWEYVKMDYSTNPPSGGVFKRRIPFRAVPK